jgi:5-formyltetrahydrofolate cyclo-ligase
MNKAEMRRLMQGFLAGMRSDDLLLRSGRVAQRLRETGAWTWMDVLLSFLSMPREIDTDGMIGAARARGTPVAVPRIREGEIDFLLMPPDAPAPARDRWGIPVPDPSWPALAAARAGKLLVCAPGLAFDRKGNRLGRGKGFYDRFLSRARADGARCVVLGICFSEQLVEEVPHEQSDQLVDGVVTEKETLLFDRTGLIE